MDSAKLILIVEDDEFIREAVTELLESEGYQTAIAENGKIGMDFLVASQTLPNLILLDLMMPVKDGFTFRDEQLHNDRLKNIPVLVMSADPNMLTKKDRLQANAYLKKPIELSAMLESISKLLG